MENRIDSRELKGIKKNPWGLPIATALGALSILSSDPADAKRRVIINNRPPQIPLIRNDQPIRVRGQININFNLGNQQVFESSKPRNYDRSFFRSQISPQQVEKCQNTVTSKERSDIRTLPPERNLTNFVYIADRYFSTDPRVCDAGDPGFLRLALEVWNLSQDSSLMSNLERKNQIYLANLGDMVRVVRTIENEKTELNNILNNASFQQELIDLEAAFALQENAVRSNNRINRELRRTTVYNRSALGTFNRLMRIGEQYENRNDDIKLTQFIGGNRNFLKYYKRVLVITNNIYSLQKQGQEIIKNL